MRRHRAIPAFQFEFHGHPPNRQRHLPPQSPGHSELSGISVSMNQTRCARFTLLEPPLRSNAYFVQVLRPAAQFDLEGASQVGHAKIQFVQFFLRELGCWVESELRLALPPPTHEH